MTFVLRCRDKAAWRVMHTARAAVPLLSRDRTALQAWRRQVIDFAEAVRAGPSAGKVPQAQWPRGLRRGREQVIDSFVHSRCG